MKPIIEYLDYRCYMKDYYEERKRTSAFTWREFAKQADFVSPTYLKLVCEGKTCLSKPGVEKVIVAMGLEGFDAGYFRLMVQLSKAVSNEEKEHVLAQMQEVAEENRSRFVGSDAYRYYETTLNPILRELAPLMPGAKPNEMAAKIKGVVSAYQVRETLHFLVQAGFLKKISEDCYQQTNKTVMGNKDTIPLAMRMMHREMANLAARSIDTVQVNERNISGITMGIDEETYTRIVEEISACKKKIVDIANASKNINQVYRMNFQLFPLTEKVDATAAKEA